MSIENGPDNNQGEPKGYPTKSGEENLQSQKGTPDDTKQSPTRRESYKWFVSEWEKLSLYERSQVVFTFIGAIIAVLGVVILIGQNRIMTRQNDLMIQQNRIMDQQREQDRELAAQTIAESGRLQSESLAASAAQSRSSLGASIDASHLAQRAWVGVTEIRGPTPAIKVGAQSRVTVIIRNTGLTPALNLRVRVTGSGRLVGAPLNPNYGTGHVGAGIGIIFPNAKMTVTSVNPPVPFTASQINLLKNGKAIIYIHGEITYTDIFGHSHWTHFCSQLGQNLTSLEVCSFYNDTDDSQQLK